MRARTGKRHSESEARAGRALAPAQLRPRSPESCRAIDTEPGRAAHPPAEDQSEKQRNASERIPEEPIRRKHPGKAAAKKAPARDQSERTGKSCTGTRQHKKCKRRGAATDPERETAAD